VWHGRAMEQARPEKCEREQETRADPLRLGSEKL
jgi:hypothetical protein